MIHELSSSLVTVYIVLPQETHTLRKLNSRLEYGKIIFPYIHLIRLLDYFIDWLEVF